MLKLYQIGFFQLILAWYDFWIGAYWDIGHRTLYICPLPMVVLRFQFPGKQDEAKHRKDRESKEPETIKNKILPIIAAYYPFSFQEIKTYYDSTLPPSFDWVIDTCNHAVEMGFIDLQAAEDDMFKEFKDSDIEKRALDDVFGKLEDKRRIEGLQAEVERLNQYTDPKLFAAASNVLDALDGKGPEWAIEDAAAELDKAVKWWDSLPHQIEPVIPPYEG